MFTDFLCGKCTKGSDNTGIALNLIECVPCDASDIVYFMLFCKLTLSLYSLGVYDTLRSQLYTTLSLPFLLYRHFNCGNFYPNHLL